MHNGAKPVQNPPVRLKGSTLARQFGDRLAPWDGHRYPGKLRAQHQATPSYARETVLDWRYSLKPCPPHVLSHYADILEARAAGDLELAARLRAESARLAAIKAARPPNFTRKRKKPVP